MKILVLGTGAREHAIAWRLKNSPKQHSVYLHPGNGGTRQAGFAHLGDLDPYQGFAVAARCQHEGIELVVIGPEMLLAAGVSDACRERGLAVVGPSKASAQLETSKAFAKDFMKRHEIPTADYRVVQNLAEMRSALIDFTLPVVVKYDGLAAGKGVIIASSIEEVLDFGDRVWNHREFGATKESKIVLEEFIPGRELSWIGLCDGHTFLPFPPASDFKRAYDLDKGPNTGGMGALCPSPYFNSTIEERIGREVIQPILRGFSVDKMEYRGALFVGLMIDETGAPRVLEFNTRFGDPETQAILMRLQSDLGDLLWATAQGTLNDVTPPTWDARASTYIVAAAEGYPAKPRPGDAIRGIEDVSQATVFFAGVDEKEGRLVTSGGRVLGVGSLGQNLQEASDLAYRGIAPIHWDGMFYRKDIRERRH